MKRLFFAFFLLILVGAGCTQAPASVQEERSAGDIGWWLSFDLPEDWVAVAHYSGGTQTVPTAEGVVARTTDIVLQNTELPILLEGDVASEEWEQYVEQDYSYVRVLRYSVLRPVPDGAVDLGNGFFSADWQGDMAYWYPKEFGNYLFTVVTNGEGQDLQTVEEIIFSAEEHDLSDQL